MGTTALGFSGRENGEFLRFHVRIIGWTLRLSVQQMQILIVVQNLLSTSLQFLTFVFQSHVWRSISKAKPPGQRTFAKRLKLFLFSPELSHLTFYSISLFSNAKSQCRDRGVVQNGYFVKSRKRRGRKRLRNH